MTDELRTRLTGIIAGDDFPVYEHVAKADLIIEVVEAPLRARIAELEAVLRPFTDVESIVPFFHDAGWGLYAHVVTKRDMEAARAAYLGEKE
jgi:hypothetical protein